MFRDEDIAFAQRLMQAGVPTELHVNPGAYHAAEVFAPQAALSERIWERRYDALRRGLAWRNRMNAPSTRSSCRMRHERGMH